MHIVGIGIAIFAALWALSWTERRRVRRAEDRRQKSLQTALYNLNPGRLRPNPAPDAVSSD